MAVRELIVSDFRVRYMKKRSDLTYWQGFVVDYILEGKT